MIKYINNLYYKKTSHSFKLLNVTDTFLTLGELSVGQVDYRLFLTS
jgi:hypothetical protein